MIDSSQTEAILTEFFITASKVSELATRGIYKALADAPECHFDILQKIYCLSKKSSDESSVAVSDLVRFTGLSPQAISRILRVLEREELICRKYDSNDHRRILIQITESGENKRLVCQKISAEYLYEVIKEFGVDNLRQLNDLNGILLRAFEAVENSKI